MQHGFEYSVSVLPLTRPWFDLGTDTNGADMQHGFEYSVSVLPS
jgi:hypothetical protein